MKTTIIFILCVWAVNLMPAQAPLTAPEALKQLYQDYDADHGTARWVCTKEQKQHSMHRGWPCSPDYATVSVSILMMAEIQEGGTDRVYLVASAVPADAPGGYDCHACRPAIGVAVFQAQEGNWALRSENAAVGFYGGWGEPPELDLVHVAPDVRGLMLSESDLAQGYASSEKILLMEVGRSYDEVWGIDDEQDNLGAIDPDDKTNKQVAYRSSAAIRFVARDGAEGGRNPDEPYDIEVISRGSDRVDYDHPIKAEDWTEVYRFSKGRYRLLRHTDFVEGKKPAARPH